jgi:hypothetical protein
MSQIRNRNSQLDASDRLPMGAFRPHPSWFDEHWLIEARPKPPGTVRRFLVQLGGIAGVLLSAGGTPPNV